MDFLSYQVYNDLSDINAIEKNNGFDIPYIVTEFSPKGHWEMPKTSWGREIEETSTEKADGLRQRIKKGLVSDPTGRNIVNDKNREIQFRTPFENGEFRLFCYLYDNNKVANANIPFLTQ